MPTMGEAAYQLRIGRVTLEKWCKRLGITPERHPYDLRYFTITPEQVEAIRSARAEMPGAVTGATRPSYSSPAFDRRQSGNVPMSGQGSQVAPAPRQRPPQAQHETTLSESQQQLAARSLPDGWLAVSSFSRRHGLNDRSVLRHARMPAPERAPEDAPWGSRGPRSHQYQPVYTAYTAETLASACQVAAQQWPHRWHRCEDASCPCQQLEQIAE